jgi:hypothetical protein
MPRGEIHFDDTGNMSTAGNRFTGRRSEQITSQAPVSEPVLPCAVMSNTIHACISQSDERENRRRS